MVNGGDAWQRGVCGWGHARQGGMCGMGPCMAGGGGGGETATEAGSTHPTGMHSC